MAHKKRHGPAPVPAANRAKAGPPDTAVKQTEGNRPDGAPFSDQDAKRRLGGFEGAGEHALQQPSQLNDGQRRRR